MKYEAWITADGTEITLADGGQIEESRSKGLLGQDARLLYKIEAATWEEANAIHHIRMGWETYKPEREPAQCPRCEAWYYPRGSGECWRCGKVEQTGA